MARWAEVNDTALKRFETVAGELDLAGAISVGKYTLFIRKIDELIESASS